MSKSVQLTEYYDNMVIWHYQLSWWRNVATVKSFKTEVSSVSPPVNQFKVQPDAFLK